MKNILITGGTSGIGLAIAGALLREGGYRVISLSRYDHKIQRAFKTHPQLQGKVEMLSGDVSNEQDCQKLYEHLEENYQQLHGLVNNAGILVKGGLEATSPEQWDSTMAINLRGPFMLTGKLLPLLKKAGNASVVNISSIAASKPGTSLAYSVSKAGLDMLTLFLAGDLAAYGIRVNAINPGLVRTNLHLDNRIFAHSRDYENMILESASRYPLGRIGKPEDVAALALFLLSAQSSWITGSLMRIDGGASVFNELIPHKKF